MSNEAVTQIQKQFDSTFAAPARIYASLVLDHVEQLASLQFNAVKAYAETGIQQSRAALDVKDPSDVRVYIESQQKVAKELGERLKGDAEQVASLNQAFVQNVQKVTQESAQKVSKAAEDNVKNVSKAAQEGANNVTQLAVQSN